MIWRRYTRRSPARDPVYVDGFGLQKATGDHFATADDPTAHLAVLTEMRARGVGTFRQLAKWLSEPTG